MIPLQMTSREQSLLAEIANEVGSAVYDLQARDGSVAAWDAKVKKLGEKILSLAIDSKPQEWHVMYDKLHRSGANS